jgi:hypothetical protein
LLFKDFSQDIPRVARVLPSLRSKSQAISFRPVRQIRLLLWFTFFAIATFCWVVVIEHGPENFIEGSKIEIENLGWLAARFFQKPAPAESRNHENRDSR